jgi:hypothetical protein
MSSPRTARAFPWPERLMSRHSGTASVVGQGVDRNYGNGYVLNPESTIRSSFR